MVENSGRDFWNNRSNGWLCHNFSTFEFSEKKNTRYINFRHRSACLIRNCNSLEIIGSESARGLKNRCTPGVFIYRYSIYHSLSIQLIDIQRLLTINLFKSLLVFKCSFMFENMGADLKISWTWHKTPSKCEVSRKLILLRKDVFIYHW